MQDTIAALPKLKYSIVFQIAHELAMVQNGTDLQDALLPASLHELAYDMIVLVPGEMWPTHSLQRTILCCSEPAFTIEWVRQCRPTDTPH